MKRLLFPALLACLIFGCSSEDAPPSADSSEKAIPDSAISSQQTPPPGAAERQEADHVLQFTNRATGILTEGYYRLPDVLQDNVNYYLKTWQLAKLPRISGAKRAAGALVPPHGIFGDAETRDLENSLKDMDKALAAMLGHYGDLEKYVSNPEIRDNGKQGKQIAEKIREEHSRFLKGRNAWLGLLDARAAEAQKILLSEHPLERQILASEGMFVIFREAAAQLALDKPDRAALQALAVRLKELAGQAAKPPFPADPLLEKEFRSFLKKVDKYIQSVDAALMEGFFSPQKKEINNAMISCRNAYNIFARTANNAASSARK